MTSDSHGTAVGQAGALALRVMFTSDLHGYLMPYDYAADCPQPNVGLVRTASLIAQARDEVVNSILLDNGDFLFGNLVADGWAVGAGPRGPNPIIAAMNALGYDAVGLGNHEFNFGLEPLDDALAQARFAVLCANVVPLSRDVPFRAQPAIVLRREVTDENGVRHTLALGVVSVMPPQVMQWDAAHLAGRVEAHGMVDTVAQEVAALRAAGADLVIVLNHSGLGDGASSPGVENAGLALARLPGVDAVLCGHKHRHLPGSYYDGRSDVDAQAGALAGVPAAMPGCWGSHLALLDLELARQDGVWRVARHRATLRAIARRERGALVPQVADDAALARMAAPVHKATMTRMRRKVGRIAQPISTHFSQVAPCGVTALIAAAQAWRVRQLLPAGLDMPLLSAAAPFRCGGTGGPENYTDLPAGPVLAKDVAAVYPFPNTLSVVRVTGAQVLEWLEHAAGQFNQLRADNPDQMLLDDAFPSYDFDILHGLSYTIDPLREARFDAMGNLRGAAAGRVRDVKLQGNPLSPRDHVLVATNSYRAQGGGHVQALVGAEQLLQTEETLPEILVSYLRAGRDLPEAPLSAWRFAPMQGVSALFRSGRAADPCDGARMGLDHVGADAEGFSLFRIHF